MRSSVALVSPRQVPRAAWRTAREVHSSGRGGMSSTYEILVLDIRSIYAQIRGDRERTGNRWQGRSRDALLHHLARLARQRPGTDDPQSLDGRKRPPLGARHDL